MKIYLSFVKSIISTRFHLLTKKGVIVKKIILIILISLISISFITAAELEKMPEFKLKNLEGETIKSSQFEGKVLVIDFWATWCGPCRKEIPGFIDLYKKYNDKGVEIIGISLDKDIGALKKYVKKENVQYTILKGIGTGVDKKFGGIRGIPTTFIIDQKGNVVFKHVGSAPKSKFEKEIKKLIK